MRTVHEVTKGIMRTVHEALIMTDFEAGRDSLSKVLKVDDIRIPISMCLGRYEAATDEELRDVIDDLTHELSRR